MNPLFDWLDTHMILLAHVNAISWPQALLALALVLAIVALARGFYEPGQLDVTQHRLSAGNNATQNTDSALSHDPVRVALFSDLHADSLRIRPQELVAALREHPVDCMVFLGDLASEDGKSARAIPFMEVVSTEARTTGTPFFAVLGNHDGLMARQVLSELGIPVLDNQSRTWTTSTGVRVQLIGLPDPASQKPDPALFSGRQDPADIRVVLAHNPDAILGLPEGSGDFFLGGHFHGGQVFAPFQLEFRLLRSDRLPRMGIWKGPFRMNGYHGYITRGLGCVWLPVRFFSKPEFSLLELDKRGPAL